MFINAQVDGLLDHPSFRILGMRMPSTVPAPVTRRLSWLHTLVQSGDKDLI